jgi:acetyltransferase-like isoleucine patch superfamily enzyme
MTRFLSSCISLLKWSRRRQRGGLRDPRVEISGNGYFEFSERITVNGHVYIGPRAYWSAKGGIVLGDNVIFGPMTTLWSYNHNHRSERFLPYGPPEEDLLRQIVVEDDVWVGLRATVLSGVTLGYGSVVGAGAVVARDVPPLCIVAGNPARPIGMRDAAMYERLKGAGRAWLTHRERM